MKKMYSKELRKCGQSYTQRESVQSMKGKNGDSNEIIEKIIITTGN
jgi:hypothetical protein